MEIDKQLFERINKKLGHFLMLNEVAVKQRGRNLTRKESKAMTADREELIELISAVDKIINS